jgi:hypothetical protein
MQTSKEYEIYKPQVSFLEEQIATLNKKAVKLGCVPIKIETLSERHEKIIGRHEGLEKVEVYVKIRITGEAPKYNGWTFAATIQHLPATNQSEAFDIIRTVPGFEIPSMFRNRGGQTCDHCGHQRYRKDTFIVCHDNGTWKQVGRQCLKDFLGHKDPHILAEQAELFIDALTLIEDVSSSSSSSRENSCKGWDYFNLQSYLKWVKGVIRVRGWMSRSNAQMKNCPATADLVYELLSPDPMLRDPQYIKQMNELRKQANPTEEDEQLTIKAIEWASQLETENDYLYNINTIAKAGIIDRKLIGYAASIIPSYQKNLEETIKKQQESVSNYFGTIGKREFFTLILEKIIPIDGMYPSFLHIFRDTCGNKAIWFASKMSGLLAGATINCKATIKEHKERENVKQTVLTRLTC